VAPFPVFNRSEKRVEGGLDPIDQRDLVVDINGEACSECQHLRCRQPWEGVGDSAEDVALRSVSSGCYSRTEWYEWFWDGDIYLVD